MAAKPEAAPEAAAPADAPAKKGGIGAMLPLILVVVLAPVLTWAVAQFVLIPQLKAAMGGAEAGGAAAPAAAHGKAAPAAKGGHGGKGKEGASAGNSYTFENVVVNLAGTMGTRYLKTTFLVTGADATIQSTFEASRPQMLDVTLNVLSSLTLTDLEEAGAKNIIREKLIQAYNQTIGHKVVEQVFFSDFVVQ